MTRHDLVLSKGDAVTIRCRDQQEAGTVLTVTETMVVLGLGWNEMGTAPARLGANVGMMPVLIDDNRGFCDLMSDEPVGILSIPGPV